MLDSQKRKAALQGDTFQNAFHNGFYLNFTDSGKQPGQAFSVDDSAGLSLAGGQLHQAIASVSGVQIESKPDKNQSGYHAECDRGVSIDPCHVQYNKQYEDDKQPSGENEQVLGFKT